MNERLREQLLGYALGALDEAEQTEMERQLNADPLLRRELEKVQESLEPLADATVEHEPPSGLAARACAYVADEAERLHAVPGSSRAIWGGDNRARWALADWVVVGGICVSAVLLFFPAILNSRFLSHVTLCQNNLRQLGTSLVQYSDYIGDGVFPAIPTAGNRSFAGFYSTTLHESGLLPNVRQVICPDSALAMASDEFRIPSLAEIDEARGQRILILQQLAGGSYAYSLGVVVNGQYMPVRNLGRSHFAIMADAPQNSWARPVHQRGQNILYEDLHVSFVPDGLNVQLIDNPYCNHWGRCEAGVDINDAVVGPSDCQPVRSTAVLSAFQ